MLILFLLQHERHFTVVTMLIHWARGSLFSTLFTGVSLSGGSSFKFTFYLHPNEKKNKNPLTNSYRQPLNKFSAENLNINPYWSHKAQFSTVERVRRRITFDFVWVPNRLLPGRVPSFFFSRRTISKETVTAAATFANGEASRFTSEKLLIALQMFAIPSGPTS